MEDVPVPGFKKFWADKQSTLKSADDTCLYATERKEGYVLRKLQRGLNAIETWCDRWNIKINEDKTQAIYFSHRRGQPEPLLTLNGRNIPFVNNVKYLGVI
jgi:hypothetical protein